MPGTDDLRLCIVFLINLITFSFADNFQVNRLQSSRRCLVGSQFTECCQRQCFILVVFKLSKLNQIDAVSEFDVFVEADQRNVVMVLWNEVTTWGEI